MNAPTVEGMIDERADDAFEKARQTEVDALAFVEEHLQGLVPQPLVHPLVSMLWARRRIADAERFGGLNKEKAFELLRAEVEAVYAGCCEVYKAAA